MKKVNAGDSLQHLAWDVAIIGADLDDRGRGALDFAKKECSSSLTLHFRTSTNDLEINGAICQVEDLQEKIKLQDPKRVLIETTTLGFAELALACRALTNLDKVTVDFLYLEPKTYRGNASPSVINKRDFDLSNEFIGYRPIPTLCYSLEEEAEHLVVFFLGFEGQRMQRALEDLPINRAACSVVFGLPAYQVGWETNAFANNVNTLYEIRGGREIYFFGADNPKAVVQLLVKLASGRRIGQRMFVAPTGSKPHGIGTALFLALDDSIGVLYDHPQKAAGRSKEISRWHLFTVPFESTP
jgi:hypothetical protein